MKYVATLFSLFFINLLLVAPLQAETTFPIKEGVHYEVFSKTGTEQPEVLEFFSFYCPHCMMFEPLAEKLKISSQLNGYEFSKSHVDFLRGASVKVQSLLTQALITAEVLNKQELIMVIFNYIHQEKGVFNSEKDIKAIFLANNVTEAEFDKTFNSFSVKTAAAKMKKQQQEYNDKKVLKGVPTFIVNGQYRIITKGFKGAKTYDELFTQVESAILQLLKK